MDTFVQSEPDPSRSSNKLFGQVNLRRKAFHFWAKRVLKKVYPILPALSNPWRKMGKCRTAGKQQGHSSLSALVRILSYGAALPLVAATSRTDKTDQTLAV
jgi:hypothetical protein